MRILGIDPGFAIVGYGVLEYNGSKFTLINAGTITTSADMEYLKRLRVIYLDMQDLLTYYRPDELAVETLLFNENTTTAINVAQARGVTLLPAIMQNLPIYEYAPLQIKNCMTGYGFAKKNQMQEMVKMRLHLAERIKPDDASDAVAIAITHGLLHNSRIMMQKYGQSAKNALPAQNG